MKKVVGVEEFARIGTTEAKAFLAGQQRPETIRVVYVDVVDGTKFLLEEMNPQSVRVGVFVRVSGQPRVIGVTLIAPANP